MSRLAREAHWTSDVAAAGTPHSMVMNKAIVTREHRLGEERREPISEDTWMNEQHRFAVTANCVFKFDIAKCCSIHLDHAFVSIGSIRH
jgi:hypothetical protein